MEKKELIGIQAGLLVTNKQTKQNPPNLLIIDMIGSKVE